MSRCGSVRMQESKIKPKHLKVVFHVQPSFLIFHSDSVSGPRAPPVSNKPTRFCRDLREHNISLLLNFKTHFLAAVRSYLVCQIPSSFHQNQYPDELAKLIKSPAPPPHPHPKPLPDSSSVLFVVPSQKLCKLCSLHGMHTSPNNYRVMTRCCLLL